MELNSVIVRTRKLSVAVEQAVKNDIEQVVTMLLENYDVYERGTKCFASKEAIYKKVVAKFELCDVYCKALTNNNTKCSAKAYNSSKYCKRHANKIYLEKKQVNTQPILFVSASEQKPDTNSMQSKFIDDSLYWIDSLFIYDKDTLEKVGYIENEEYIITDDPFILSAL